MDSKIKINKPFIILAPMDDVTDTVFRQIVADCASPDYFMTEFINAEGMQSAGRKATATRTRYDDKNNKVIAQIWGKVPEHFETSARELIEMGYIGIDINFGCPEKNVVKNGCCSAMIKPEGRTQAMELIAAARRGVGKDGFLSVKTRLGFNEIDYSWHELILKQKVNMLTVHVRTRKEMSKVPAQYEAMRPIVELRNKISPDTLLVVNGDIINRTHGEKLIEDLGIEGAMIGRGIFHDPFAFSDASPWESMTPNDKINLLRKHVDLFSKTWANGERDYNTLKRYAKIYVNGFDGAKDLRVRIMDTKTIDELINLLSSIPQIPN